MKEDRSIFMMEMSDPDVTWLLDTFAENHENYRFIELDDGSFCYVKEEPAI